MYDHPTIMTGICFNGDVHHHFGGAITPAIPGFFTFANSMLWINALLETQTCQILETLVLYPPKFLWRFCKLSFTRKHPSPSLSHWMRGLSSEEVSTCQLLHWYPCSPGELVSNLHTKRISVVLTIAPQIQLIEASFVLILVYRILLVYLLGFYYSGTCQVLYLRLIPKLCHPGSHPLPILVGKRISACLS